jgi:hypothetical protein
MCVFIVQELFPAEQFFASQNKKSTGPLLSTLTDVLWAEYVWDLLVYTK